ncbi:asparaginase domain-containing protein [Desulfobaculum bizertense]|uniref:L-asparaginase n=1 Tax=Desulfobaculum bizertense DSM 18034 TaxID=1121442 RepID=A0A1T4VDC4_9BACT|nr:asparaginase domain-containing protein [Desulfobaculum bizertense]UIJ37598.1 asparaginase [Desulfobaculum bizertense]SKA62896.1 L-asparaginase [Desulfobaculum bizertense DSM 18034]
MIRILVTGGTLDKEYNQLDGELVFTKTHITDILRQAKCTAQVSIETVMLKDSLHMSDADRECILERVKACPEDKVVITHGTDTMPETAAFLGQQLSGKTVVLLGAMVPYSFVNSDALFNLGCAFSAVQLLPEGAYITMNGKIFSWDNVRKNRQKGEFETLD